MNDDNLSLQPVGPADRDRLAAFARAYHDYDGHDWAPRHEAALDQLCAGTPYARAFLLRVERRAAGYASLSYGFSIEVGGLDFFLDEFFLEAGQRGRGHGRRFLALMEAETRRLGGHRLCLEAELHNARAEKLYRASGYRPHERHLMSKEL